LEVERSLLCQQDTWGRFTTSLSSYIGDAPRFCMWSANHYLHPDVLADTYPSLRKTRHGRCCRHGAGYLALSDPPKHCSVVG